MQYYNLDSSIIDFAVERSPEKWGKYTIGTGIKIISEENITHLNKVDIFIVNHSLHHSPNPALTISNMARYLKKGGLVLINEPEISLVFKLTPINPALLYPLSCFGIQSIPSGETQEFQSTFLTP